MVTLRDRIYALINVIAAAVAKNARNIGDLNSLATNAKTSAVVAINELFGRVNALPTPSSIINDAAPASSTTSVWSAHQTQVAIDAKAANLAQTSAQMLATLQALGQELATDENAAAALTNLVANKVDFGVAQNLSGPQQLQARTNIGALGTSDLDALVGPDTDFVAYWNSVLAAA